MKIACIGLEDWEKVELEKKLDDNLQFYKDFNVRNIDKDIEILIIFIDQKITKEVLEKFDKLKLITTMSTGYDHIDIGACNKKDVTVCNVPRYGENTVAEHTFGLILALSRKLYPSIKRTHEKNSFETDKSLRGFDLKGKTIGIIGLGNIGKHVARIAKCFEMSVVAYDLNHDKDLAKKIGFEYVTLDQLYKQSDIITLHVPYNKHTHHLIDKKAIDKMKQGVYIINTARGEVIDTDSLVKALKTGHVAGAGLDVLEEECEIKEEKEVLTDKFKKTCDTKTLLEDHMLMNMENVIVTPHNAFNSNEALQRIIKTTIENIKQFEKQEPQNVVS